MHHPKTPALGGFDLEIANRGPSRIGVSFVPAIQNFLYLTAMALISEGLGVLIDLIAAVTRNLYSFVVH